MEQRPEIIVPNEAAVPQQPDGEQQPSISQPGKLLRIASMIRELVEEVRQTSLDEKGSKRLADVYQSSLDQLKDSLSEELQQELEALALPLESGATEAEVRVAQAQLLGWLEGLFHGIQAA
ncbi:MAG: proteasome activator, partial [Actinomycetota bacterium]